MNRWVYLLVIVVLGLSALIVRSSRLSETKKGADPFCDAAYLWQSQWTPSLADSVKNADEVIHQFMILAAELHIRSGQPVLETKYPDWNFLKQNNRIITPVIRLGDSAAPYLAEGHTDDCIDAIRAFLQSRNSGVPRTTLQLDYDCPSSKLESYAVLLHDLKRAFPEVSLSITALPAWVDDDHFPSLASDLDYYVLQVHSLEKPDVVGDDVRLYRSIQRTRDLERAEAVGVPYYLAFPTYGYELAFDSQGRYRGILTGGVMADPRMEYTTRLLMADPDEIASDVLFLHRKPPSKCLGIAWFRLPVERERLNWSWPALKAVIQGRSPQVAYQAEIRSSTDCLYELWISNTGERNLIKPLTLLNPWERQPVIAFDCMNGFRLDSDSGLLTGMAPDVGRPVLAAWFRVAPNASIQSCAYPIDAIKGTKP